jgi:ABC-2 type transport system ATP-binding protein
MPQHRGSPYTHAVAAVEISDLLVRYGNRAVVDRLGFTANAGEITALIGPNGAGKTTTVEVCVGLRARQSGTVQVLGRDPRSFTPDDRARIGVMLQDGGLYPTAQAGPWLRALSRQYREPRDPEALMEQLGIDPLGTTVRRMSGGEVQRLKLASALIGQPEVLFLDEPTTALDAQARAALLNFLTELRDGGTCIVLTTHLLDDVEQVADRVTIMNRGTAVLDGTVAELTGTAQSLRFRATAGLPLATLQGVLPDAYLVRESGTGTYVIEGVPTPSIVATITNWCAEQGILATDIRTGRGTLADLMRELEAEAT